VKDRASWIRDETVPQYRRTWTSWPTLINEVNNLHVAGYTFGKRQIFFEDFETAPNTLTDFSGAAAYIRLSMDVKGLPDQVAVGGQSGDPGDNENGLRMLGLQTDDTVQIKKWVYENRGADISNSTDTETMDDYYRTLAGEMGILTDEVSRSQDFDQAMLDRLGELRDSVSGVNLDEEMTELIKLQRAHEAAARLITVADEMLQSLLEIT
jgi:flagellar hook-associated protein 1 FlgK